jgi:hypothetical protein
LNQAAEAIECHIEGLLLDGEAIPPPTSIDVHHRSPDYADGVWALIPVDVTKLSGKTKRVNVTIPERLLALMDDFASQRGETRSGLITQATLSYITSHG